MVDEIFAKHKEAVLCYSGGKDSLAVLLLLKPYWDRVTVVWVNTGNCFPEITEHMERIRLRVPHFVELKSNSAQYFLDNGFPVDLVPNRCTKMGQYLYGPTPVTVCNAHDCCKANIWDPLAKFIELTKPTCVIRGDRGSERVKGKTEGMGAEWVFPIFDWSREKVVEFIKKSPLFEPRHEMENGSSLDCRTCMAYANDIPAKLKYLKENHDELYVRSLLFYRTYMQVLVSEVEKIKE
jgi:phosphoadenosine phosphosulfate reductase